MKHCIGWLLMCCLVSCSSISSTLKSGSWHIEHKQLIFSIPTADTQKPVIVPREDTVTAFPCEYSQKDWATWHQTRMCLLYKDAKGVKWVLILSKNRQYAVLMTRNGEEVYFLPETPMVDI